MTVKNREDFDKLVAKELLEKRKVKPKTDGQKELIEAIEDCSITLCYGPPGSGKSHLAIGLGIQLLRESKVEKLIFIRPLQECGRPIGYLPGDKGDKIKPHMQVFENFFSYFMSFDEYEKYKREGKILVDTLEFLRGATFNGCYIVLDESQNATYPQIKMLLTRIGNNTKIVLVGDITQTDLNERFWVYNKIPFDFVIDKLDDTDDDIAIVELTEDDIVRHGLVRLLYKKLP